MTNIALMRMEAVMILMGDNNGLDYLADCVNIAADEFR